MYSIFSWNTIEDEYNFVIFILFITILEKCISTNYIITDLLNIMHKLIKYFCWEILTLQFDLNAWYIINNAFKMRTEALNANGLSAMVTPCLYYFGHVRITMHVLIAYILSVSYIQRWTGRVHIIWINIGYCYSCLCWFKYMFV